MNDSFCLFLDKKTIPNVVGLFFKKPNEIYRRALRFVVFFFVTLFSFCSTVGAGSADATVASAFAGS
jgi:hypothetical protein